MIGAVEAGGTKIVCAVGTSPDDLVEERFPTTTPAETLGRIIDFFSGKNPSVIGIGTFGPADIDPDSPTFGHITNTPKPGWKDTDFVGPLKKAFGVPVVFDTDVNGAAIGEGRWGAAKGIEDFIYITVGTGIGGGVISGGKVIHGRMHPEIGHLLLPHDKEADPFAGSCPFHGDCFEGLASGPAIGKRWNMKGTDIPPDHEAWPLHAHYMALACINLTLTLSPKMIILGGGVMEQQHLFPMINTRFAERLNGYVEAPAIVPPGLGNKSGILGAFAMAMGVV